MLVLGVDMLRPREGEGEPKSSLWTCPRLRLPAGEDKEEESEEGVEGDKSKADLKEDRGDSTSNPPHTFDSV